jgi:septal ring factor EnvC (AmiA/AmiB activator)
VRKHKRCLAVVLVNAIGVGTAFAEIERMDNLRTQVVQKASGLVADKISEQKSRIRIEALALYRVSQRARVKSWVAPETQGQAILRAAWRVLRRDLRELAILENERERLLQAQRRHTDAPPTPGALLPGSLSWPVKGSLTREFGTTTDDDSGLSIAFSGMAIAAPDGSPVVAVAAGTVLYVGAIRGLGLSMVVAHRQGDVRYLSVLGPLAMASVPQGSAVIRGQSLGISGGRSVYLEIRLSGPIGTIPVDPLPLLEKPAASR